jgi:hypothetical protein
MDYTLTIVQGEQRHSNGVDLSESPIRYEDLPADVQEWMDGHCDTDHPDIWVLVTPADEDPQAVNVIDSRDIVV